MANRKHKDTQEVFSKKVRELAKHTFNRQCCECEQPGVTYVDITVGNFVCTSCSGILRGLNPPHRVKSISMTTFSQQEVEFLQSHGNEFCSRLWLGKFDQRSEVIPDSRDPRRLKDFLQEKYEKKKWAVSQEQARAGTRTPADTGPIWSPALTDKALPSPQGSSAPALSTSRPTLLQSVSLSQPQLSRSWQRAPPGSLTDLRTDAITATLPRPHSYGAPPTNTGHRSPSFPSFDSRSFGPATPGVPSPTGGAVFPALPRPTGRSSSSSSSPGSAHFPSFSKSSSVDLGGMGPSQHASSSPAPSGDKYAPLTELENVFVTTSPVSVPPSGMSEFGSIFRSRLPSSSTPSSSPGVSQSVTSAQSAFPAFSNPFRGAPNPQQSLSPTNPFHKSRADAGDAESSLSAAPSGMFQPAQPPLQNSFLPQQHNGFATFPVPKSMPRPIGQPVSNNPFTGGVFQSGGSSTNPFL
ncbi:arf-GAP domain and FG repeat-containing protein 1-like isoform X2 [Acipenser ruthenus]|uniref:arf-GAP domain and FG repeat-containing protein 1-like isoform X2 n=1 Tax=Acipenser ruthenus TaxID=7906 RepID=UPI0027426444|nr:arf-GAP domain and FG repeat-containing protein 1-like isoform X2 [Acipenser ruthenus]